MQTPIAIIGMAGRFPQAANIAAFWQNLCAERECISFFDVAELRGTSPTRSTLRPPNYVPAAAVVDDVDLFDAGFFGINPREAELMDPQHRLFLECAWTALEDSGYGAPAGSTVGVFTSSGVNAYLLHLIEAGCLNDAIGAQQLSLGNDKDFLPNRVSYRLDLRGPSMSIQCGCSSSLVAIHCACQSLLRQECEMALAGGTSARNFGRSGYTYDPDGIESPDGHCRAFDADARGTVAGDGVAAVVLKRLPDAIAGRDFIYAVIKGSWVNNDGNDKIGFTAPSIRRQAELIALAHAAAGVEPETITYIEAHGTGTRIGDPIEVEALTRAFRRGTARSSFCALGSVKTNIGHLDAAAGVAGLVKTALALHHRSIPASLNFHSPNPEIDFASTPFYVNVKTRPWDHSEGPRRAGVSSFGIGGTNAHIVLEEAPAEESAPGSSRNWLLVPLSARSADARSAACRSLAAHLRENPALDLQDVAYTLQVGRRAFPFRRAAICLHRAELLHALDSGAAGCALDAEAGAAPPGVGFFFSGSIEEWQGKAPSLCNAETVFARDFRLCLESAAQSEAEIEAFACQYALARLYMSWGVRPALLGGEGPGEYVAAVLAGVLDLNAGLLLASSHPGNHLDLALGGISQLHLRPPKIPCLSNETGDWLTSEQATDPYYWRRVRGCVSQPPSGRHFPQQSDVTPLAIEPKLAAGSEDGALIRELARLWLLGVSVDWQGFHPAGARRRLPLPTYVFERQRYWADLTVQKAASSVQRRADFSKWFYAPSWKRSSPRLPVTALEKTSWLIFEDVCGVGAAVAGHLQHSGAHVLIVRAGDRFAHEQGIFTLDPSVPAHYEALTRELESGKTLPAQIVYAWTISSEAGGENMPASGDSHGVEFSALYRWVQAWAAVSSHHPARLLLLTNGLHRVDGTEELIPGKGCVLGLVRVAPRELPQLSVRNIDLPGTQLAPEQLQNLLGEVLVPNGEPIVALRGAFRWIEDFDAFDPEQFATRPLPLKPGGTYLIAGGLGGIGLEIARYLHRTLNAKLALITRTPLPDRNDWPSLLVIGGEEDETARRVRAVLSLEEDGAQLSFHTGDIANREQIQSVANEIRKRFGPIHGAFHCAGDSGGGLIQARPLESALQLMAAKTAGAPVLEEVLRGEPAAVLVLSSSLSSILGGIGQSDYSAANAYLDAFAQSRASSKRVRTISINWDTWQVGMARRVNVPGDLQASVDTHVRDAITSQEALAALDRILRSGLPQVIVSRYSLPEHYAQTRRLTTAQVLDQLERNRRTRKAYPLPAHLGAYVAPRTSTEQKIAAIWEELLGLERIGIQHNFLEAGGHSLLATRVIARIHEQLNARVSLNAFLSKPTIAALAELVDGASVASAPGAIPRSNPAEARFHNLVEEIGRMFDQDIDEAQLRLTTHPR